MGEFDEFPLVGGGSTATIDAPAIPKTPAPFTPGMPVGSFSKASRPVPQNSAEPLQATAPSSFPQGMPVPKLPAVPSIAPAAPAGDVDEWSSFPVVKPAARPSPTNEWDAFPLVKPAATPAHDEFAAFPLVKPAPAATATPYNPGGAGDVGLGFAPPLPKEENPAPALVAEGGPVSGDPYFKNARDVLAHPAATSEAKRAAQARLLALPDSTALPDQIATWLDRMPKVVSAQADAQLALTDAQNEYIQKMPPYFWEAASQDPKLHALLISGLQSRMQPGEQTAGLAETIAQFGTKAKLAYVKAVGGLIDKGKNFGQDVYEGLTNQRGQLPREPLNPTVVARQKARDYEKQLRPADPGLPAAVDTAGTAAINIAPTLAAGAIGGPSAAAAVAGAQTAGTSYEDVYARVLEKTGDEKTARNIADLVSTGSGATAAVTSGLLGQILNKPGEAVAGKLGENAAEKLAAQQLAKRLPAQLIEHGAEGAAYGGIQSASDEMLRSAGTGDRPDWSVVPTNTGVGGAISAGITILADLFTRGRAKLRPVFEQRLRKAKTPADVQNVVDDARGVANELPPEGTAAHDQAVTDRANALAEEMRLDRLDPQFQGYAEQDLQNRQQSADALTQQGRARLEQPARDAASMEADRQAVEEENQLVDQRLRQQQTTRLPSPDLQARPEDLAAARQNEDADAIQAEDREATRRARAIQYSADDLRSMPNDRLRAVAQDLGVTADTRTTTLARVMDRQEFLRLSQLSNKDLWDEVRAQGLRAGTRQQNVATLLSAARDRLKDSARGAAEDVAKEEAKALLAGDTGAPRTGLDVGARRAEPAADPFAEFPIIRKAGAFDETARRAELDAMTPRAVHDLAAAVGINARQAKGKNIDALIGVEQGGGQGAKKSPDIATVSTGGGSQRRLQPPGVSAVGVEESLAPRTVPVKRKAPGRTPFTKSAIEQKLLSLHESQGGGFTADDEAQLNAASGSGQPFTFYGKLPGEVRSFIESNPAARRLFRVTGDRTRSGGEDAMQELGDRYWTIADNAAGGRLKTAKESLRRSGDPFAQFWTAVHDNLPPAKERPRQTSVDPAQLQVGQEFTLNGDHFQVVEHEDGYRVLKDGDDYPATPVDALGGQKIPVDTGSLTEAKEPELPEGDPFAGVRGDEGEKVRQNSAQPPATSTQEPPVAPGTARFYHGGADDSRNGPRWFSPDRRYAEEYARKSGGTVSYLDLPEDHPLLSKMFDDTGTSQKAPYNSFEAPEAIARQRRPLDAVASEPIAIADGIKTAGGGSDLFGRPAFEAKAGAQETFGFKTIDDAVRREQQRNYAPEIVRKEFEGVARPESDQKLADKFDERGTPKMFDDPTDTPDGRTLDDLTFAELKDLADRYGVEHAGNSRAALAEKLAKIEEQRGASLLDDEDQGGGTSRRPPGMRPGMVNIGLLEPPVNAAGEAVKGAKGYFVDSLIDRVRNLGTPSAREAAALAEKAVDVSKATAGQLSPELSEALKLAGGGLSPARHRAVKWLQEVQRPAGKDYGVARIVDAVEGRTTPAPEAAPLIDALQKLTAKLGRMYAANGHQQYDAATDTWRPFRTTRGDLFVRTPTEEMQKILRQGRAGPLWNRAVDAFADLNGLQPADVEAVFNQQREQYMGEGPDAAFGRLSAEFTRTLPRVPTHLFAEGDQVPLFETRPYDYARRLAERGALRVGVVEQFGQSTPTDTRLRDLRDRFVRENGNSTKLIELMRALHGHAVEDPYIAPGTFSSKAVRTLNTVGSLVKSGLLSMSVIQNIPESLGNTQAFGSFGDLFRATRSLGLHPQATIGMLETLGAVTKDVANVSLDPNRPIESAVRAIRHASSRVFLHAYINELQEKIAAAVAFEKAERMQAGKGGPGDVYDLRMMGYGLADAKRLAEGNGTPFEYDAIVRKAPGVLVGNPLSAAEKSRASHARWFRALFAFTTYAETKMRSTAKQLGAYADIARDTHMGTKSPDDGKLFFAANVKLARYLTGTAASGVAAYFLMSLATGGRTGGQIASHEAQDDGAKFILKSWAYTTFAGPFGALLQAGTRDNRNPGIQGYAEDASRATFPGMVIGEALDAAQGNGTYRDMEPLSRFGKLLARLNPATRGLTTAAAAAGFGEKSHELDTTIRGYWRWRMQNAPPDFRAEARRDNADAERFRMVMRSALGQMKEGKDPLPIILQGLKLKDANGLAVALRNKKLLEPLDQKGMKPGLRDDLRRHIGPEAYERLQAWDDLLGRWEQGVKYESPHGVPGVANRYGEQLRQLDSQRDQIRPVWKNIRPFINDGDPETAAQLANENRQTLEQKPLSDAQARSLGKLKKAIAGVEGNPKLDDAEKRRRLASIDREMGRVLGSKTVAGAALPSDLNAIPADTTDELDQGDDVDASPIPPLNGKTGDPYLRSLGIDTDPRVSQLRQESKAHGEHVKQLRESIPGLVPLLNERADLAKRGGAGDKLLNPTERTRKQSLDAAASVYERHSDDLRKAEASRDTARADRLKDSLRLAIGDPDRLAMEGELLALRRKKEAFDEGRRIAMNATTRAEGSAQVKANRLTPEEAGRILRLELFEKATKQAEKLYADGKIDAAEARRRQAMNVRNFAKKNAA